MVLERAPALGADGVAVGVPARHPALAAQRLHLLTEDVGAHLVGLANDVGESLVVTVIEAHITANVNPFVHLQIAHASIVGVGRRWEPRRTPWRQPRLDGRNPPATARRAQPAGRNPLGIGR